MSPNVAADDSAAGCQNGEGLACHACKNRKLKCDRVKPACSRCSKSSVDCVYPEARRKPEFKRKNVKELEARLAQVEVLLKEASEARNHQEKIDTPVRADSSDAPAPATILGGFDYTLAAAARNGLDVPETAFADIMDGMNMNMFANQSQPDESFSWEMIDLGMTEPLPPFEVMEALNKSYFERQPFFVPMIHEARYYQSFYSAPHMKPPMCLQYAMWALTANTDSQYGSYHDIFYRRARQYAEADELKGQGEHFITLAHAQTWCLIATYEAKSMLFTRASMSGARAVRLVNMMGLHRLDGPPGEIAPTLLPPRDWIELEERRRVLWGVYCIDSHCSISTGWPHLVDESLITTRLPSSEAAFASGTEEQSPSLYDAFKSGSYSSFAGAILTCHVFNQVLKHVHRPQPNDSPEDYEYGEFWQRHRSIDNTLTGAFMFLPSKLRLPENYRDPIAVNTNLNLHAAIICLHNAAVERIDKFKLPIAARQASQNRLIATAQEVVNIVRITSATRSHPKSPLAALTLYCAGSVYIQLLKDSRSPLNIDNLNFMITAMESLARDHMITRAFLRQLILDVERNDLLSVINLPRMDTLPMQAGGPGKHTIPLLARSATSRHTKMPSPLPDHLPLKPNESGDSMPLPQPEIFINYDLGDDGRPGRGEGGGNKRRRKSPSSAVPEASSSADPQIWNARTVVEVTDESPPSAKTSPASTLGSKQQGQSSTSSSSAVDECPFFGFPGGVTALPHRTSTPSAPTTTTTTTTTTTIPSTARDPDGVAVSTNVVGQMGPQPFITFGPSQDNLASNGVNAWQMASLCMASQFTTDQHRPINNPPPTAQPHRQPQPQPPPNEWGNIDVSNGVNLAAVNPGSGGF